MKTKISKFVSRLLVLALCVGLLSSVPAFAADITYEFPGGKLSFDPATGTIKKVTVTSADVVIPAEIQGVPVTKIGDGAFDASKVMKSVTLPEGITSIGYGAFTSCYGLTSATIPDSVTEIGRMLFYNCSALQQVKLGRGLTSIPRQMFEGCTSLTSFDIPDHITYIGFEAFYNCSGLKSVTIPGSVKEIDGSAFKNTGLTSVTVPDSVTKLGDWVFAYSNALTSVKLSNSLTTIPMGTFENCHALTSVIVPDGVKTVNGNAFRFCSGLKTVSLPASLEYLDGFYGCKSLTDVYYGSDLAHWTKVTQGSLTAEEFAKATVHFSEPVAGFSDVMSGDYYAEAVKWAKNGGVTGGTSETTFSPADPVTRGQAVTFLWRAAGKPEPTSTASPFADVTDPGAFYYKAVLWAKEQGITNGIGGNLFGINGHLQYDQLLAFLCRSVGAETTGDWSQGAMNWATTNGLTSGLNITANEECPRADVVYFLWKQLG